MKDLKDRISALSLRLRTAQSRLKEAEMKQASLKASKEQLMKRLAEEFKVNTIEEAKEKISQYDSQIAGFEKEISELEALLTKVMDG